MTKTKPSIQSELHTRLSGTKTAYAEALSAQAQAAQALVNAKRDYFKAEANAVIGGSIVGKNEVERKANAQVSLSAEVEAVQQAEDARARADLAAELAKLDWNEARELVKVYGLDAG